MKKDWLIYALPVAVGALFGLLLGLQPGHKICLTDKVCIERGPFNEKIH